MSLEGPSGHRSSKHAAGDTYFVGRRLSDDTEVYSVTANDVRPPRSERRYGQRILDWHGTSRASERP
jgi:hypothetical protein